MADSPPSKTKAKRFRSPAYPGIGLEEAIAKSKVLFEDEGRAFAPVKVVLDHWGFADGSGKGASVLSALKQYGIVEYEGTGKDRRAQITDRGYTILEAPPGSSERSQAIKQAALGPTIHEEMWNEYGADLPSSDTLEWKLKQRQFNHDVVRALASQYRDTLSFAGLLEGGTMSAAATDSENSPMTATATVPPPSPGLSAIANQSFVIPITRHKRLLIEGSLPLSHEEWERIRVLLNVFETELTVDHAEPDDHGE